MVEVIMVITVITVINDKDILIMVIKEDMVIDIIMVEDKDMVIIIMVEDIDDNSDHLNQVHNNKFQDLLLHHFHLHLNHKYLRLLYLLYHKVLDFKNL